MKNIILLPLIAICLLVVILLVRRHLFRKRLRKEVLKGIDINYSDTAQNIALSLKNAKNLYKELIIKVHPDRFLEEYKDTATDLSSKITESKRNYSKLLELKVEVNEFLTQVNDSQNEVK